MNDNTSLSASAQRSLLRRFFSWKTLRRALICLAVFVTFVALLLIEENWRGKRAWENYKRELIARGTDLNWKGRIPPPVPDGQNFAMTPLLASLFDFNPNARQPGQSLWRDSQSHDKAVNFAEDFFSGRSIKNKGRGTDDNSSRNHDTWIQDLQIPSAGRASIAAEVLTALEEYKSAMDELREASHRPFARFNVNYDEPNPVAILLPHLGTIRRINMLFQLHALAELASGHNESAFADIKMMFYLAQTIEHEPFLISHLVRLSMLKYTQLVVDRGIIEQKWSDAQLQTLQAQLQKMDLIATADFAMSSERAAFGVDLFDLMRKRPETQINLDGTASEMRFMPSGWLYLEQVSYQKMYDNQIMNGVDLAHRRFHPRVIDESSVRLDQILKGPPGSMIWNHRIFASMLLPALQRIMQHTASVQTIVDQSVIACALERYRLAHGSFPESLDQLSPEFAKTLPSDVMTGEPMKYHREDENGFILYSVGWNEQDDKGEVVMKKKEKGVDPAQGDWVWPQAKSNKPSNISRGASKTEE